jgi:uncharacterized protein YfiM (DUF2279 family)
MKRAIDSCVTGFSISSLALTLLCLSLCFSCFAQTSDTITLKVNQKRLSTVIIGSGLAYTASMVGLSSVWYSQYGKQAFRFFNDAAEWKQVDKVGHFYSAFQLSAIGSNLLQWSSVSKNKSDKAVAVAGLLIMSSIEVLDGYSSGYGASGSDILANALGASFYLGQNLIWNETRIYPKFSFHRTDFAPRRPNTLGSTFSEELLKDYNGQTYWLSVDMDKFIPFPKWLNLSVGYGANEMVYANEVQNAGAGYTSYRQYYLSLDFDLTAYRSRSKLLNTLIFFVNMIKLPAPGLEFSNGRVKGHPFSY